MKDSLGDRIKDYENITRYSLPRRTYTILRLDGKAFHTYTKGLKKPFDSELSEDITSSVSLLLKEMGGAKFAYCQSDEISILMTDVENISSQVWFNGNIQKIASVSSSILTAEFNRRRILLRHNSTGRYDIIGSKIPLANFDCRVFSIPDRIEVMNYFRWRNQDCRRNSISMVAYSLFSHKSLQGKSSKDKISMIEEKIGKSYHDAYTDSEKYGTLVFRDSIKEGWDFSKDNGELLKFIPEYSYE